MASVSLRFKTLLRIPQSLFLPSQLPAMLFSGSLCCSHTRLNGASAPSHTRASCTYYTLFCLEPFQALIGKSANPDHTIKVTSSKMPQSLHPMLFLFVTRKSWSSMQALACELPWTYIWLVHLWIHMAFPESVVTRRCSVNICWSNEYWVNYPKFS